MADDMIIRAMEVYKRVCDEHTPVYNRKGIAIPLLCYQVPSWYSSDVGRKYVYLRNCNGFIARYNIETGENYDQALFSILNFADQTGIALQHRTLEEFSKAMNSDEDFVLKKR